MKKKKKCMSSLNLTGQGNTIWEAAKHEWTKHICNLLVPIIEDGFRNIYTNCERSVTSANRRRRGNDEDDENDEDDAKIMGVITAFKQTLKNIPKWNQEIVDIEYNRIITELRKVEEDEAETMLDDLVKAAFTSHILILTSVNLSGQRNKKVEMHIPSSKRFVHKVYIEAARLFYRSPHLFARGFDDLETLAGGA